ncbi:hypothetical protein [Halorhabdus amylolytica]|uniref:hypothetical protein n=1 Tax=Halorhabdus amylolytica TaxID=2559573 RepID=UPI0010AA387F|nr:hypothetical protein [Halorhabdus amylolytica]
MVPLTRRSFLHGATGLTAVLAGCSGLGGDSAESTATPTRVATENDPAHGSTTDPESLLLRVDTDRPPVWLAESDGEPGGRPTANERDRWRDSIIVDDSTRADRLKVAENIDRERVGSFFGATDFATETVYVEMGEIEECFRLELCHVSWSATEISTDYTRRSRPYTDRCEADKSVIEARLIRIPDSIKADDVHSYSSSIGAGACDRRQGAAKGDGGAGPASVTESDTRTEATTIDAEGEE